MDEKLRDASASATHMYSNTQQKLSLRKDVFFNIKAFSETKQADYLTHEERIYMQEQLIFGKKMGLLLGKKDQQRLIKLDTQIIKLERDFHGCLDEDSPYLFLKEEDLSGVPLNIIKALEKDENGKRKVPIKSLHNHPVMTDCYNPKTRFLVMKHFYSRCKKENVPILEESISLTHRRAKLLGIYANVY